MLPLQLTLPALALTLLLQSHLSRTEAAVTLHVAPGGDDRWSGKLLGPDPGKTDGPLATLQGARDRVRAIRREPGKPSGPITVLFADGTYLVTGPVTFEPADGGTSSCAVGLSGRAGSPSCFRRRSPDPGFHLPPRRALDRQGAWCR